MLLALLTPTSPLGVDARDSVLAMVAQLEPARRRHALYELATLREEHGRFDGAREALESLVSLEEDGRARAALHLKRGELLRGQRNFGRAKVAYEQALLDDPSLVAALRALIELSSGESERLVALVERLATLAGPEATAPYGPSLVEAYERLGRPRDAYRALAALAETTERVRHRLRLAEALGLTGEALALREKLAITSEESSEAVLLGYLDAQLIPFAVRLGVQSVETSSLSPRAQRVLAERLSSTPQGASLASRLWPALGASAWRTSTGGQLRRGAAQAGARARGRGLAHGFGAVLSDSAGASPTAQPTPVEGAGAEGFPQSPPATRARSQPRVCLDWR